MAILTDRDRGLVEQELAKLAGSVKLIVFTQELGSEATVATKHLIQEVAELSDKVSMEVWNAVLDREKAEAYGVDKIPAVVVEGARDYGIRFFGLPAGYEFANLIDAMLLAASGQPQLSARTLEQLGGLTRPVHIQVFTTPT